MDTRIVLLSGEEVTTDDVVAFVHEFCASNLFGSGPEAQASFISELKSERATILQRTIVGVSVIALLVAQWKSERGWPERAANMFAEYLSLLEPIDQDRHVPVVEEAEVEAFPDLLPSEDMQQIKNVPNTTLLTEIDRRVTADPEFAGKVSAIVLRAENQSDISNGLSNATLPPSEAVGTLADSSRPSEAAELGAFRVTPTVRQKEALHALMNKTSFSLEELNTHLKDLSRCELSSHNWKEVLVDRLKALALLHNVRYQLAGQMVTSMSTTYNRRGTGAFDFRAEDGSAYQKAAFPDRLSAVVLKPNIRVR